MNTLGAGVAKPDAVMRTASGSGSGTSSSTLPAEDSNAAAAACASASASAAAAPIEDPPPQPSSPVAKAKSAYTTSSAPDFRTTRSHRSQPSSATMTSSSGSSSSEANFDSGGEGGGGVSPRSLSSPFGNPGENASRHGAQRMSSASSSNARYSMDGGASTNTTGGTGSVGMSGPSTSQTSASGGGGGGGSSSMGAVPQSPSSQTGFIYPIRSAVSVAKPKLKRGETGLTEGESSDTGFSVYGRQSASGASGMGSAGGSAMGTSHARSYSLQTTPSRNSVGGASTSQMSPSASSSKSIDFFTHSSRAATNMRRAPSSLKDFATSEEEDVGPATTNAQHTGGGDIAADRNDVEDKDYAAVSSHSNNNDSSSSKAPPAGGLNHLRRTKESEHGSSQRASENTIAGGSVGNENFEFSIATGRTTTRRPSNAQTFAMPDVQQWATDTDFAKVHSRLKEEQEAETAAVADSSAGAGITEGADTINYIEDEDTDMGSLQKRESSAGGESSYRADISTAGAGGASSVRMGVDSSASAGGTSSTDDEKARLEDMIHAARFKHVETPEGHMIVNGMDGTLVRCEDEVSSICSRFSAHIC